jgi:hypothetical protein
VCRVYFFEIYTAMQCIRPLLFTLSLGFKMADFRKRRSMRNIAPKLLQVKAIGLIGVNINTHQQLKLRIPKKKCPGFHIHTIMNGKKDAEFFILKFTKIIRVYSYYPLPMIVPICMLL